MGIFNHIGEKGKEDSTGIINFGILATEYVRQEQMANYLQKGKNQMNSLRNKKKKKKKKKKKNLEETYAKELSY